MSAKNLEIDVKKLFKAKGLANFELVDDIVFISKREGRFLELEASFITKSLEFRNLPGIQAIVWFGIKIFASSKQIQESEVNSITLEISSTIEDLNLKRVFRDFDRRFQSFMANIKTPLVELIFEGSTE